LERGALAGEGWAASADLENSRDRLLAGKLKPGPGRSAQEVASHQLGRIHAAMIESVAKRGYDAVTVRELTRCAGISSRSFYKHYAGKEECFLATHRLVALKSLGRLSESQTEASDAKGAVRLAITRIARDLGSEPNEAYLLLLAPYRVSERAVEQLRQTELIFRARLERGIANAGSGGTASAFAARAIVDGLTAVACSRLMDGRGSELASQASELAEWATSLVDPAIRRLDGLDEDRHPDGRDSRAIETSGLRRVEEPAHPDSDHALLLAAVTKLVTRSCKATLTPGEIVAAAGLTRSAFHANFPDVESCVAAALDSKLEDVMQRVRRAARGEGTPAERVHRAVDSLCSELTRDPALSSLCCGSVASTMVLARRRLQSLLVAGLRPVFGAMPNADVAELRTQASAGAIWGNLQHRLAEHPANGMPNPTAHLTYLMLAPAIGGSEAIEAMQRERTLSAA